MVTRTDPEKHKAQVRAANRARYKALQTLVARHPAEFAVIYADEAAHEGVEPKPREKVDAAAIQAQIKELTKRLKTLTQDAPA
jgi:hypothetical protein